MIMLMSPRLQLLLLLVLLAWIAGLPRAADGATAIIPETSCTFDDDCALQWEAVESENGWIWNLTDGESRDQPPYFDHTNFDPHGRFQAVYVWNETVKSMTVLRGPDFDRRHNVKGRNCFSFWYFMHGDSVPRLSAYYRVAGDRPQPLWAREGDQGPTWQQAFVQTPYPRYDVKYHIEFSVMNTVTGGVAIDDVLVYDGPCPNDGIVCDFEDDDLCGFRSPTKEWSLGEASKLEPITGLDTDRTTETASGSYVYINERNKMGPHFGLKSPWYPPTMGRCLKFYYSVANNNNNNNNNNNMTVLEVRKKPEQGDAVSILKLSSSGAMKGQWVYVEKHVVSSTNFQIVFLADPEGGVISLDNIQMSTKPCHESYGCDFEQGLCSWSTSWDDHSNLDWQLTAAYLVGANQTGPDRDVSSNSSYGHYLYLETSEPARTGDVAVLTSQRVPPGSCLTFYYSMTAQGTGSLSVNITDRGEKSMPKTIWSKTGSQGTSPQWRKAVVNTKDVFTNQNKDIHLSLIGTVGSTPGANIAVDQIDVQVQGCGSDSEDHEKPEPDIEPAEDETAPDSEDHEKPEPDIEPAEDETAHDSEDHEKPEPDIEPAEDETEREDLDKTGEDIKPFKHRSNTGWKTGVAVIGSILFGIVLALVVLVVLVRTNRMRAPTRLQRMIPLLKTDGGSNSDLRCIEVPGINLGYGAQENEGSGY